MHKQSFFTHGIGADGIEQGYPSYYFSPNNRVTDVCVLRQVNWYKVSRDILAAAMIFTQLLIGPFLTFVAWILYISDHAKLQSIIASKPNIKHYFIGFVLTVVVLGLPFLLFHFLKEVIDNHSHEELQSTFQDKQFYYIMVPVMLFLVNPLLLFGSLTGCVLWKYGSRFSMNNLLSFFKSHGLLVVILLLLTGFSSLCLSNSVYVTIGLIIAPYKTGSFVFLYLSVFFLVTMFFSLVSKLHSTVKKPTDKENHWPSCANITTSVAAIIYIILVLVLYLAFYYRMTTTMEPHTSSAGVMSFFGSLELLPSICAVIIGFLEKHLINLLGTASQQNISTVSDQIKTV